MSATHQLEQQPSVYESVHADGDQCATGCNKNVGTGERAASVAGGLFMIACGLKPSASMIGRGLPLLAGAGLLYRGITGDCKMYRAMGIDRS